MNSLILILILFFLAKQVKDQTLCKCIYIGIALISLNYVSEMYDGYCSYSIPDVGYTEKNPPAECKPNDSFTRDFSDTSSDRVEKIDSCGERIIGANGEILSTSVTCQGEVAACETIGLAQCNDTPGCSINRDDAGQEICGGTRTPCDGLTGSLCSANTGCSMTSGARAACENIQTGGISECTFVSSQCDQHAENPEECNREPGCYYQEAGTSQAAQCSGSPTACGAIMDETICTAQQGCTFSAGACSGTQAGTCDGTDPTSCTAVDGCTYTEATQGSSATCRPLREGDKIVSYDHLMNSYKCSEESSYYGTVDLKYSVIGGDGELIEMNSDFFGEICQDDESDPTHELTLSGCELQEAQVIESETCSSAKDRFEREGSNPNACGNRGWKYSDTGSDFKDQSYSGLERNNLTCGFGETQRCLPEGGGDEARRVFEEACCKESQPCYTYDGTQVDASNPKKTCEDVEISEDGLPKYVRKTNPTGFNITTPEGKNTFSANADWEEFEKQTCKDKQCNFQLYPEDIEACCTQPQNCGLILDSSEYENYDMDYIINSFYPDPNMTDEVKRSNFCGQGDIDKNIRKKMKELPANFQGEALSDACSLTSSLDNRTCNSAFFGSRGNVVVAASTATTAATPATTAASATTTAASASATPSATPTPTAKSWWDIW